MHTPTHCSKSTKFSSLVTSYSWINPFLWDNLKMVNFLILSVVSFMIFLSTSKSPEMMTTTFKGNQKLHCFIFPAVKSFVVGTRITFLWNQKQMWQHLKRASFRKSLILMKKSVPNQTAMHVETNFDCIQKTKPPTISFYSISASPSFPTFTHPNLLLNPIPNLYLKPPRPTHKRAQKLGWAGMVRDPEFFSLSITRLKHLVLCDCGLYCDLLHWGTGSVMTAGLMFSG